MFSSTLITPRDLLVPAGEPVSFEVEVERRFAPFIDPPFAGAKLDLEGQGSAITDGEGQAAVPLRGLATGNGP